MAAGQEKKGELATTSLACSRLRDGGGKSFSNTKCEKREDFRFARFNTFPLYYLIAWHRLLGLWNLNICIEKVDAKC